MLCLHQHENNKFYPTSCQSNEKHSNRDKTMDYLANYPCSIESVSQIEKQLWHKLRNILSLNPVSVRILQFLKTRSRISKPTFITLMLLIYKQRLLITTMALLLTSDEGTIIMVSLIRCHQMIHRCYSKRNQKGLANFSQSFS